MPLDLYKSRKLYPDATQSFRWEHSSSGTEPENSIYYIRTPVSDGESNHAAAAARGLMPNRPQEWKNVEVKIYFDGETGDKSLEIHLGGSITASQCPCCCFSYNMYFSSNGIVKLRKQTYFGNYTLMKEVDAGILPAGYKGVAFTRYNLHNNSHVALEAWIDKTNKLGQWKRVMLVTDDGNTFGRGGLRCGAGNDRAAGTWSFPVVAFINKGFTYNYLDATAREINVHGSFNEAQYRQGQRRPTAGGGGIPLPGDTP